MGAIRQVAVRIGGDVAQLQRAFSQAESSTNKFGKSFDKVGDKMKSIGGDMTSKISLPLAGLGGFAIATTAKFEQSMSSVQAFLGGTSDEMATLTAKAREMGAKTSKSASEAADAMSYMALAGWDVNQIMEGTEPILRLSEAGNIDLARASDLVTDSMSSLGLKTKDLGGYLDKLAQSAASSNTNIDMIMEAMNVAGGQFKNLNTPLSESTALLGVLANRSIKGSEAGNALSSILVNLGSGAGQAGEGMKEIGLSAFDAQGKFKGITNVLRELNDKVKPLTEEKRFKVLSKIGGKEQISTLNALMAGVDRATGEYDQLYKKIDNSNGALDRMVKVMQGNLIGQLTILKSTMEELGIQIGMILLPHLKNFVEFITKLANKFGALPESIKEVIIVVAIIVGAIGPLLVVLGTLISIVGSVIGIIAGITSGMVVLIGAFIAVGVSIMAVVGFFVLAYQKNEAFRESINFLAMAIKERFEQIGMYIIKAKDFFVAFYKENETTIQNFINKVVEVFAKFAQVLTALISGDMEKFKTEAQNLWKKIQEMWALYVNQIIGIVGNLFLSISQKILEHSPAIREKMKTIVFAILSVMGSLAIQAPGVIGKFMFSIASSIFNKSFTILAIIQASIIGSITNKLKSLSPIGYNAGKLVIGSIINGVDSKIQALKSKISSAVNAIANFFPRSPAKEGALRTAPKWGGKIIEQLNYGLQNEGGILKNTVDNISSLITIDPLNNNFDLFNETEIDKKIAVKNINESEKTKQIVFNITGNTILNERDISRLTESIGYNLKLAGM
jgi:TP901 family phage tail tape measure protein